MQHYNAPDKKKQQAVIGTVFDACNAGVITWDSYTQRRDDASKVICERHKQHTVGYDVNGPVCLQCLTAKGNRDG